jgi:hypothetical protein
VPHPQPSTELGARSRGGNAREREAGPARTYVLTVSTAGKPVMPRLTPGPAIHARAANHHRGCRYPPREEYLCGHTCLPSSWLSASRSRLARRPRRRS